MEQRRVDREMYKSLESTKATSSTSTLSRERNAVFKVSPSMIASETANISAAPTEWTGLLDLRKD